MLTIAARACKHSTLVVNALCKGTLAARARTGLARGKIVLVTVRKDVSEDGRVLLLTNRLEQVELELSILVDALQLNEASDPLCSC